jgi:hypothetical protein
MKITISQLRKLITESINPNNPGAVMQDKPNEGDDTLRKLKTMVDSDPSIENIRQVLSLADPLNVNIEKLKSSLGPAFMKFVQSGNTLDSVQADNIIDEIDDNLFRARDLGLQVLGIKSVDKLRTFGELTDDQIYEIDAELINSVKDGAREAIERAIAQVFAATLK